jgi:hypothetical protein
MTRSATRRAVRAGWLKRVFSQDAQTKLPHHKPRTSTAFGAGPFIFRKSNFEDEFNMARLVNEKDAADAVGLDLATFHEWVSSGRLPRPIADCGKYDLKAIDAAIDRISGLGSPANALDAWRSKVTRHASAS